MNIKWYTDEAAKRTHAAIEAAIKPICEQMMPNHLFTHMGINRDDITNEIVIKLHLRPIGEARQINERLNRGTLGRLK